jgi:hypothetical protein
MASRQVGAVPTYTFNGDTDMSTKKHVTPPKDVNTHKDVLLQDYTLQHEIHHTLTVALVACLKTANCALINREPDPARIINNAFEAYHGVCNLMEHFEIRGYEVVTADERRKDKIYSVELSDIYYYLCPEARAVFDEIGVEL